VETSTRWIFFLQGGASCAGHVECRDRWCGRQGIYDASKMSSRFIDAAAIGGTGILNGVARNPYHDANVVFFYYCSSDQWTGQRSDVVLADEGGRDAYRLHFRGHSIIEAALARLRQGGATSDDGVVTLPDLDDAREILWTGVSAGGAGATHHLDWFAAQFDADQTRVSGVIDAGFGPPFDQFDADTAAAFRAYVRNRYEETWSPRYGAFLDTSCVAHPANQGENAWRCSDPTYVKLNHVTTRFFQRLDLRDAVGSRGAISLGATLEAYAAGAAHALERLAGVAQTGHEGGGVTVTPGAYGPNCTQHVAITDGAFFFQSTVEDADGRPSTFVGALSRWLGGQMVSVIDAPDVAQSTSVCGPRD